MPRGQSAPKPAGQHKGWLSRAPAAAATPPPRRARPLPRPPVGFMFLPVVLAGRALWLVPSLQLQYERDRRALSEQLTPAERLQLEKELIDSENSARSTLALILAAGGLLLGM